jgi:hypothetical protein
MIIKINNVKDNLPNIIKVTASGSVKTFKIKK